MSASEDKINESEMVTPTRNSFNCINASMDSEGSSPLAIDLNLDSVDHPLSNFNQCSEPEQQNVEAGEISLGHASIDGDIEQAIPLTTEENTAKERNSFRNFIQNLFTCRIIPNASVASVVQQNAGAEEAISIEHGSIGEDIEQAISLLSEENTDKEQNRFVNFIQNSFKCLRKSRASVVGVSQDQILPQSPPEPPLHFDEAIDHPKYLQKLKTDMLPFVLFGLLLSIADLGTDIWTGISHFNEGNTLEGSLTIGIVLFAGIISSFCYIKAKEKRWKELFSSRVMRFLMYVPCTQLIVMTIESMRFDAFLKTDILSDRRRRVAESESLQKKLYGSVKSHDDSDVRHWFKKFHLKLAEVTLFFKTAETVLEAGPQAFLQLFLIFLRVQQGSLISWKGREILTILTSLFSIALCARGNFMSKFIDRYNKNGDGTSSPPPPFVVTILLDGFSVFNYYFRIVVCVTGFVCLLQAFLFICPWYLAGILTFLVIIIPRIVYIRYDILYQVRMCISSMNKSETNWNRNSSWDRGCPGDIPQIPFSDFYFKSWLEKDYRYILNRQFGTEICQVNISAYYIITQIVVTLVCSGPKKTEFLTPLDSLAFKRFLILEPIAYLGFWGLIQSLFTETPNLFFIILLSLLLLMFYVFHFLIEKFLLKWITEITIEFQLKCGYIIDHCEIYLQEVKSGIIFSSDSKSSNKLKLTQWYLNKASTGNFKTPTPGVDLEKANKINLLITFYKDYYFHFSESQLQVDLLEKQKYIETLFKFTMIKLTFALLSTQWNETEVFLKAVHLVLSYIIYMEDSKKYSIKKIWTYCKYFNDPKKQFRCQGLIYKFNQEKMPTLQYLDSDAHPDSDRVPDPYPDSDLDSYFSCYSDSD